MFTPSKLNTSVDDGVQLFPKHPFPLVQSAVVQQLPLTHIPLHEIWPGAHPEELLELG